MRATSTPRGTSPDSMTWCRSSSTPPPQVTGHGTHRGAGTWPMADQSTKQARKRRRPLESYSKPWLGTIAIAVVAVLVGAMLLVKAAGVGYRHYTAQFL